MGLATPPQTTPSCCTSETAWATSNSRKTYQRKVQISKTPLMRQDDLGKMIGNSPLQSIHLAPDIVCTIPAVSVRVSEAVAFLGGKAPGASKTLGSSISCSHSLLENDLSLCPDHGSNLIQPTATGVPVPLPPSFEFSMPGISTFCHALPIHVP